MSCRTRSVAVAVRAIIGTDGKSGRSWASWRYSGRKSWPHSLMQWASSTARRFTFQRRKSSRKPESMSRSGATYSRRYWPVWSPRSRARDSPGARDEFKNVAGTPPACKASTWSFISAIKGETTTVSPGRAMAGNWKQRDFPPPVGSRAKTSLPASASAMICCCKGRKEVKPKYCFSSGSNCVTCVSIKARE